MEHHALELDTPILPVLAFELGCKETVKLYRVCLAAGLRPAPLQTWLKYCKMDDAYDMVLNHTVSESVAVALCSPPTLRKGELQPDAKSSERFLKDGMKVFETLFDREQFSALDTYIKSTGFSKIWNAEHTMPMLISYAKNRPMSKKQAEWIPKMYGEFLSGDGYERWLHHFCCLPSVSDSAYKAMLVRHLSDAAPRSVNLCTHLDWFTRYPRGCYRLLVGHKDKFRDLCDLDAYLYCQHLFSSISEVYSRRPAAVQLICSVHDVTFDQLCAAIGEQWWAATSLLATVELSSRKTELSKTSYRLLRGIVRRIPPQAEGSDYLISMLLYTKREFQLLGRPGPVAERAAETLKDRDNNRAWIEVDYNFSAGPEHREWLIQTFELTPAEVRQGDHIIALDGEHEDLRWLLSRELPLHRSLFEEDRGFLSTILTRALVRDDAELAKNAIQKFGGTVPAHMFISVLRWQSSVSEALASKAAKVIAGATGKVSEKNLKTVHSFLRTAEDLHNFHLLFRVPKAEMAQIARLTAVSHMANNPREMKQVGETWTSDPSLPVMAEKDRKKFYIKFRSRFRGELTPLYWEGLSALGFASEGVPPGGARERDTGR